MSLILGILAGLVLGLTGAGGAIFGVPLLMFGLDWPLTRAAPVALLGVACAAGVGSYIAWRNKYLRYRAAALMAVLGAIGAPLGLRLADQTPHGTLSLLFAGVLIVVSVRMLRQPSSSAELPLSQPHDEIPVSEAVCKLDSSTGRILWTRPCTLVISAVGAVTGFLSGLLGVGGGFIIVPSLRAVTELTMQAAVATSLLVVGLNSLSTVIGALFLGREIPMMVAVPFVAGNLAGMLLGRWLMPHIGGRRLQIGFAVLMLLVAIGLAAHSLSSV